MAKLAGRALASSRALVADESGQGTTEYAILVGVLVVIAIVAIIAFRDRVSELWDAIASGINSL
ncbi:Flp family type IVb pilin [Thermophilibacter immobilis]|uniref:Class III signal peptide-containing protein n=1 Tax=Thermophilibacter immobilis TaxID=2779519 RepID=A0A7S7MA20_9ACTN|nr:class III signal peptide-containing protein [Thermophilibacter immobilis]